MVFSSMHVGALDSLPDPSPDFVLERQMKGSSRDERMDPSGESSEPPPALVERSSPDGHSTGNLNGNAVGLSPVKVSS